MCEMHSGTNETMKNQEHRLLFWACFVALIATAFGFIVRTIVMNEWADEFGLNETQKGELFGVGLWPFAVSMMLFSLVIDRIGYGRAMIFAFMCHVASAIITIAARGYWSLYWGNLIVALGNGTVEAVVNPVVATLFVKEKTKWLNILHAGWPGGLVIGGLIAISMAPTGLIGGLLAYPISWHWKVGLILIPTAVYGLLMLGCRFPISERVAAGVSYRDMLKEFGGLGAFIVIALLIRELGRVFEISNAVQLAVGTGLLLAFAVYVQTWGRPIFIFLLLIMIPLATTELGTDSWITPLMEPEMADLNLQAGWVIVYTSLIMMILRFFAGPMVHKLSPLGLLAASSLLAALGLVALSQATGAMILAAATLYGFGKTFFWPTMLGVVAEQFPKGGALTLNATGAVGALGVGVIGAVFLGYIQDQAIERRLHAELPGVLAYVSTQKTSVFGAYRAVDPEKVLQLEKVDRQAIQRIEAEAKKSALATVAIFPGVMLICYLVLIAYYRARGGYRAQVLPQYIGD